MVDPPRSVVIAGAGVFGASAALALRRRGHEITLVDPGPLPSPQAASTDVSKVVRREYGTDEIYFELGDRAIEGWRRWNREWPEPLYHEVGLYLLSKAPMEEGGFEGACYQMLLDRGYRPDRLTGQSLSRRSPAWSPESFPDGFFQPASGYAESGRVVQRLLELAEEEGVRVLEGEGFADLLFGDRAQGIRTTTGREIRGDTVVVAAGAWTGFLLGLDWGLWASGHPVFHLRPADPSLFAAERFPVFTADIAETGWYGFPLNRDGVVKVARHALGRVLHPDDPRELTSQDFEKLRSFLSLALPPLAEAEVVYTRLCLYSDTSDGHFWIDEDPDRPGLFVAAGGSGHGFKFAPVLGDMIADAVERKDFLGRERFRWRTEAKPFDGEEEARAKSNE